MTLMSESPSLSGCNVTASEIRARIANHSAALAADLVFKLEQRRIELGAALWTGNSHIRLIIHFILRE